jgi:type VI protein secretion system component VasK
MQDPTALTTAQLLRELVSLREIVETRLNAIDKATQLFQENLMRVPTDTDKQIAHLKSLHDEKFAAVSQQFKDRDIRSDQDKQVASTAVTAALQAQKDLIALQNSNTTKQVDSILALLASTNTALNDKVGVINGRLDRGDGGHSAGAAYLTTGLAVAAIIVSLGVGVFSLAGRGSVTEMLPASAVTPR